MTTGRRRFTIAELVARTGVPATTIHHYRRLGLVPPAERIAANRFLYDERHAQALQLIRLLRERRKLPLDTLREILPGLLAADEQAFRPEMWERAIATHLEYTGATSPMDRLLDAGARLFAERGVGEVSVADVCEAAGIGKGTFYRHFASKEALLAATVESALGPVLDELSRRRPGTRTSARITSARLADLLEPSAPLLVELLAHAVRGQPESEAVAEKLVRQLAEHAGPSGTRRVADALSQLLLAAVDRGDRTT